MGLFSMGVMKKVCAKVQAGAPLTDIFPVVRTTTLCSPLACASRVSIATLTGPSPKSSALLRNAALIAALPRTGSGSYRARRRVSRNSSNDLAEERFIARHLQP